MLILPKEIIASAERAVELYNSVLSKEDIARLNQTAEIARKSMGSVIQMIQSPAFQGQVREINRIAEQIRKTVEQSHALTLPALRMMEELYGTVDKASEEVAPAYSVPEAKREEVIALPIFSETKLTIRKGIPSVRKILPLSLPKDVHWEGVRMRFVDPHNVFIEILKYNIRITVNYEEMGMQDLRTKLPNAQWKVLRELARHDDGISWKTPVASPTLKKNKQLLAMALKRYFNIDGDPFFLYRKEKTYRLKMVLIPDEAPQEKDRLGVKEYFDEQAPEVYGPKDFLSDD